MSGLTSFSSLQVLLKETYRTLLDDKVKKLVLLGEPGVGKSWMARKLSDHAIREGKFELTLWVFLNRKYDYNALCESIARQLSLLPISEEWEAEDESRESNEYEADVEQKQDIKEKIYEAMKGKEFLLILDDEGSQMTESDILSDLKHLLHLDGQVSYKFLITRANNSNGPVPEGEKKEIGLLSEDELLSFLIRTVDKFPGFEDLARDFIKKIEKLPTQVVILGKALSYFGQNESGVQKLRSALDVKDFDVMQLLTSGYELLPNWILIDFFCNDNHFLHKRGSVHYNELISYWIMEGYLGNFDCMEKAYEVGHSVLMELISCGLLKRPEAGYVSMTVAKHNLDDCNSYHKYVATTRLGLASVFEGDLGRLVLANGMIRTVSRLKGQKKLSALLLDVNHLNSEVPNDFFQFWTELEVLAIFNPGHHPFPLHLFDMQDLHLLVLRGCVVFEKIEDILLLEPLVPGTSDPGIGRNQPFVAQISNPNSIQTPKLETIAMPQSSSPSFVLKKLTTLEISGPSHLKTIPDKLFSHMPQLKSINLSFLHIESLPSSIYTLKEIIWLILRGCLCLQELGSLKRFEKLQILDLSGAKSFKHFHDKSLSHNQELQTLNLSESQIASLPLIRDLKKLTHLLLNDCSQLERIRKITTLSSLQILDLSGAKNFKEFPDPAIELPSFKIINISRTAIDKLPSYIGSLDNLYVSGCSLLKELPYKQSIKNLLVLDLSGSCHLQEIKESFFHDLTCLRVLNLSETSIESLPSLLNLHNLRHLLLSDCLSLKVLNDFSSTTNLEILDLSGCKALKEIKDTSFEKMEHLQKLDLSGTNITHLPSLPAQNSLHYLLLRNCSKLEVFPSLKDLSRLKELDISGIRCIGGADFLEHLDCLQTLDLSETLVENLPSLLNLKNLKYLSLRSCQNVSELPGLEALTSLEVLDLSGTAVKDLPSLKNFGNLKCLLLRDCFSLEKFKNLEVLQVLEAAIKELPYEISELMHLQQLELPNFGIRGTGSEKFKSPPGTLKQSQWSICNWPAESTINVEDFQILQLLQENPTFWETSFSRFHFFVHPTGVKSIAGDKNSYRNELFLQDRYFQTKQLPFCREQARSLEIRGFHDLPRSLEHILAHAEFVFLIDNSFLSCLSDLGADNIKLMKGCWIENCSSLENVLNADDMEDVVGSGESTQSKVLKEDDRVVSRMGESLETLLVSNAAKVKHICGGNLQSSSLKNLKCLSLESCPEITNVFPSSPQLENLEVLQVRWCHKLEVLFEHDGQVALPRLLTLQLWALPKLTNISCSLPSLQTLKVGECPLLVNLASANQPLKSLNNLQIKFCDRLETVFEGCKETSYNLQILCLWDLPKLKSIGAVIPPLRQIRGCPKLQGQAASRDVENELIRGSCK